MEYIEEFKCINPVRRGAYFTPCGKCLWCKQRAAEDWIIRLNKEFLQHKQSLFVTLTYDENNVPIDSQGVQVVRKHDVQLFFRYLRRLGYKFKYYGVSEYGPTTYRPHYHIILFGVGVDAYNDILACWSKGFLSVYPVLGGSINYVSRYSLLHSDLPSYLLTKERKPFKFVSKGIGRCYCDDMDIVNYHKYTHDTRICMDGYFKPMPRYYRNKIFTDEHKEQLNSQWARESTKLAYKSRMVRTPREVLECQARIRDRQDKYDRYSQKVKDEFTKKAKI